MTTTITWRPVAKELPKPELCVLLWSKTEGAFEGFRDAMDEADILVWRDVTGLCVDEVTHWAELPEGPQ